MCVVLHVAPDYVALPCTSCRGSRLESQGACAATPAQKSVHCSARHTLFSNQTISCCSPTVTPAPWVWAPAGATVACPSWRPCRSRLPPAGWCAATGMPPLPQRRLWTPPHGAGEVMHPTSLSSWHPTHATRMQTACLHAPCKQLTPLKQTHCRHFMESDPPDESTSPTAIIQRAKDAMRDSPVKLADLALPSLGALGSIALSDAHDWSCESRAAATPSSGCITAGIGIVFCCLCRCNRPRSCRVCAAPLLPACCCATQPSGWALLLVLLHACCSKPPWSKRCPSPCASTPCCCRCLRSCC